jgi:hypothetical protein
MGEGYPVTLPHQARPLGHIAECNKNRQRSLPSWYAYRKPNTGTPA